MIKHGLRLSIFSTFGLNLGLTLGLALLLAPGCAGDDGGDSMGDGDTSGDGDSGDGDGDSGDGDGDSGDGDGDTGELMGCGAIMTEADCVAEAGCGPVMGRELMEDGDGGWCTMADELFIGCASTGNLCPMLGKSLCDGQSVWYTTGCVPDNLMPCETPGGVSGPC